MLETFEQQMSKACRFSYYKGLSATSVLIMTIHQHNNLEIPTHKKNRVGFHQHDYLEPPTPTR